MKSSSLAGSFSFRESVTPVDNRISLADTPVTVAFAPATTPCPGVWITIAAGNKRRQNTMLVANDQ